jgi:hypothetical protein
MKNKWSNLNHIQLGKYSEYLVIMEFTRYGFDVYSAEVDDKGIDFVVRKNENKYFDIQVKSLLKSNYAYMPKKVFEPRENLFLALVRYESNDTEPTLLLIPSMDWKDKKHSFLVESKDFEGKKSKPEWGINITNPAKQSKIKEYEHQIDEMVYKLYGLTPEEIAIVEGREK